VSRSSELGGFEAPRLVRVSEGEEDQESIGRWLGFARVVVNGLARGIRLRSG
jgi:hypothetical protein